VYTTRAGGARTIKRKVGCSECPSGEASYWKGEGDIYSTADFTPKSREYELVTEAHA
jgi:hypothetical protein